MFVTSQMALIFVAIELCAGSVIGIVTLAIIYRSRLRSNVAMTGAIVSSLVFLFACGVGGWADSHSEFVNGKRTDFASWGEDLRVRNFLAENEFILAAGSSALATLAVGVIFSRIETQKPGEIGQPHL